MSDHIRRAERKEREAQDLLREARYLRDLDRRLKNAEKVDPKFLQPLAQLHIKIVR